MKHPDDITIRISFSGSGAIIQQDQSSEKNNGPAPPPVTNDSEAEESGSQHSIGPPESGSSSSSDKEAASSGGPLPPSPNEGQETQRATGVFNTAAPPPVGHTQAPGDDEEYELPPT